MRDWKDLKLFAESQGFTVTSTTGGSHNRGSKHFRGLAIDVRTRDRTSKAIELFIVKCAMLGVIVRDERAKPPRQKVWSGAHLHLEIGNATSETVKEFQRKHGLSVDGIAGRKTIAVLDSLF